MYSANKIPDVSLRHYKRFQFKNQDSLRNHETEFMTHQEKIRYPQRLNKTNKCHALYLNVYRHAGSSLLFQLLRIPCDRKYHTPAIVCKKVINNSSTGNDLVIYVDALNLFFPIIGVRCELKESLNYSMDTKQIVSPPTELNKYQIEVIQEMLAACTSPSSTVHNPICLNVLRSKLAASHTSEEVISGHFVNRSLAPGNLFCINQLLVAGRFCAVSVNMDTQYPAVSHNETFSKIFHESLLFYGICSFLEYIAEETKPISTQYEHEFCTPGQILSYALLLPQPIEIFSSCFPGFFNCADSCVSHITLIDGTPDCPNGMDELGIHINTTMGVTTRVLHWILHYICSDTESIPWYRVCDGQKDCKYGQDEEPCVLYTQTINYLNNSKIPVTYPSPATNTSCGDLFHCVDQSVCIPHEWVDDLAPDCPVATSEEEPYLLQDPTVHPTPPVCTNTSHLPCQLGHSRCFPLSSLCLYELDTYGHITHCRNGHHLRRCELFECSTQFKCPGSYCISMTRVCDGKTDCMLGEDESQCPPVGELLRCPGMLHCKGGLCVDLSHVCDGVADCPYGDDELFCNLHKCNEFCTCIWHTITCHGDRATLVDAYSSKLLTFIRIIRRLPLIINGREVLIVNASHSRLITLYSSTFDNVSNVRQIDLRYGKIRYIKAKVFNKLSLLNAIYLTGNPLYKLDAEAFYELKSLTSLNFSNMSIETLESSFHLVPLLSNLDVANNRFQHLNLDHFKSIPSLSNLTVTGNPTGMLTFNSTHTYSFAIATDISYICCIEGLMQCNTDYFVKSLCFVESSAVVDGVMLFFVIAFIVLHVFVACLRRKRIKKVLVSGALTNINLAGVLLGISHLAVNGYDWLADSSDVKEIWGFKHVWCIMSGFVQCVALLVVYPFYTLHSYSMYLSSTKSFGELPKQRGKYICILTCVWLVSVALVMIKFIVDTAYFYPNLSALCTVFFVPTSDTFHDIFLSLFIWPPIISFCISIWLYRCIFIILRESRQEVEQGESRVHQKNNQIMSNLKKWLRDFLIVPFVLYIPQLVITALSLNDVELKPSLLSTLRIYFDFAALWNPVIFLLLHY